MTSPELENLKSRLINVEPLDYASAESLLRDSIIYARKTFGEQSPHISVMEGVQFRDPRLTYNSGHHMNNDNWNGGAGRLQAAFEAMSYEIRLEKMPVPIIAPQKMTLEWLFKHVPIKLWVGAVTALVTAFSLGYSAGKSDLLRQFISIFYSSASP